MTGPGVHMTRQLAAIMFTDIVGYTSLMGSDEQNAFQLLRKSRQIQQPLIENYGGKWIKELGDGILASFDTATDAVQSAMHIIEQCNGVPNLHLRIGIHLGDVVFENNDVFGDGVNIASRLLQQATPGSIFISGPVYDNVANKKGINCQFIGEELLKNVRDPVKLYEVKPGEGYRFNQKDSVLNESHSHNEAPAKSIAVLPFVNMSNDIEQEYFSDGITEEILNSLAQVKDLHVAGRTSSFYFKNKNFDLRKIGQKLNVQNVLEGSVRKSGDKLRVTAQLIKVENGFHLWSEKYDRQIIDIFQIQDDIAMAITEKLKATLLENERNIIQTRTTWNHEAYDLYLKGRFYFNKRGKNIIKGMKLYQQALEKDPEFALPYTGLADAYCILSLYCMIPPHEAMPKARKFAQAALKLHHSQTEALTALAFISTFYDWNWEEAKKIFDELFESGNNYAPAQYWYSYYLSFVERNHEEAVRHALIGAEKLEPLVPIAHHILSIMYFNAGNFEEGLAASKTAIELDENSYPGHRSLGLNLGGLKRYTEAVEAFRKAIELSENQSLPMAELCWIYYHLGMTEEIEKIFEHLRQRSSTEYISSMLLGCIAWFMEDKSRAIEYLEQAINNRDPSLIVANYYLPTNFLRTDPEMRKLMDQLKFPD